MINKIINNISYVNISLPLAAVFSNTKIIKQIRHARKCIIIYMSMDCIYIPYSMEMVFVVFKFDHSRSHIYFFIFQPIIEYWLPLLVLLMLGNNITFKIDMQLTCNVRIRLFKKLNK